MSTLLSFGEVLVDLLPTDSSGLSHQPIAGGAPANVAVGYAKLGGTSLFAGGISADDYGVMLQQALTEQGVDTRSLALIPSAATATVLVSLDENGERSFSFNRQGTADMLYRSAHFDAIDWSRIDIFHLCSNTFTEEGIFNASLYGALKAHLQQKLVCFDVNLRLSLWDDISLLAGRVEQCFAFSHVLKMSKDEAEFLANARGVSFEDYLSFCLAESVKLILVTNGPEPVQCYSADFAFMVDVPKIKPVDTTAAGDSFVAGLLFKLGQINAQADSLLCERLANKDDVRQAVEFAIQCGAITCAQKGAFPALPTISQLQ
ncbi:carbohydrate kinase family protein [Shewanella sp. A14]